MKNKAIRDYASAHGVRLWQIAAHLVVNDGNFSRRLRFELSQTEQQELCSIIDQISQETMHEKNAND